PRGDGRDDASDPRADGGAHGDPRRAQDEGRHEDLRPHHRPAPGAGAGRGHARGDPRQRARAADLPRRHPLMALLELEDVHTYYGEANILQAVSLGVGTREAEAGSRLEDVFRHFPRLRERVDHRGQFLSGGEQQMVAIARALVARPTVMLVDEPTEGLAPMLVQNLTEILAAINRGGTTILLVEQTLEVALALSRRVYVMDQGRIQFQGTPEAL